MRFGDWLDERVGHRALLKHLLDEPVRGGARFAYVWGSTLVFLLLLQGVTGALLASFYAPSSTDAWASVAYLQQEVTLGWLVRGLHSMGASAIVIVTAIHLLQVTVWGAYRRPRELNWYVGLVLMLLLFAFALTGYLLPWDQKGYWATQVATSLVGALPAAGPWLKRLLQGGPEYGNLTLTHFYALHVLVLPSLTVILVGVHVALMRRHGVTPGWRRSDAELDRATEPFWPGQLVRDLLAMALVLAVMVVLVWRAHGVGLEAPADPAASYEARPEWYFLPLYQLLKYFPGPLEIVAAVGAPLVASAILFALPLVDRAPTRDPRRRKRFVAPVVALLVGAVALGLVATQKDRHDPAFRRARVRADDEAARALTLARLGVPPAGGTAVYENDPHPRARRLYAERCQGCHLLGGAGEEKAPDLDGWSSRGWLRAFLRDPAAPRFYGATRVRGMKPVKVDGADFDALVEWIYSLGGSDGVDAIKAERGKAVFDEQSCGECHAVDATTAGDGVPNLGGRASTEWIAAFLRDPGAPRFFDAKNRMPKLDRELSPADVEALVQLLRDERAR